jgi:integrase
VQAEAQLVRYEAEQLSKRRRSTQRDYRSILQRHVRPALGRHKISAVDFANIDRLHQTVTKASGPYRGNRVIAVVSKLFSLAMQWKRRADNPCRGIERNIESKRKRYLSGDELQRLSRALAEHDDRDAADIIRVLLLTGARRGEVLGMKWADVADGVWTKPAASTKQRAEHIVPLSAPARQILAARPRGDSPFIFPGRHGRGHRIEIKYNWKRICRAAALPDLRIHDLRHSFASIAVARGASLHEIGALLGHATPTTTARYAHLADDHLREVTNRVGAVIEPKRSAKILPLK